MTLSVLGGSRVSPSSGGGIKTLVSLSFVGPNGIIIGGGCKLPEGSFRRWEFEVMKVLFPQKALGRYRVISGCLSN